MFFFSSVMCNYDCITGSIAEPSRAGQWTGKSHSRDRAGDQLGKLGAAAVTAAGTVNRGWAERGRLQSAAQHAAPQSPRHNTVYTAGKHNQHSFAM